MVNETIYLIGNATLSHIHKIEENKELAIQEMKVLRREGKSAHLYSIKKLNI